MSEMTLKLKVDANWLDNVDKLDSKADYLRGH